MGVQSDMTDVERLEGPLIDIGDVSLEDAQAIDLEIEGQGLQRLLPAAVLERHVAGGVASDLAGLENLPGALERPTCARAAVCQVLPSEGRHRALHMRQRR